MAEQFEMLQYIDIATQNLICVILRENQHQCTIKELKNVSLVLPCEASAHKPSIYIVQRSFCFTSNGQKYERDMCWTKLAVYVPCRPVTVLSIKTRDVWKGISAVDRQTSRSEFKSPYRAFFHGPS